MKYIQIFLQLIFREKIRDKIRDKIRENVQKPTYLSKFGQIIIKIRDTCQD